MLMILKKAFNNPPDEYLPWAYWFWNGDIDSTKIRFQLEEIKRRHTVSTIVLLAWEGLTTEDREQYGQSERQSKIAFGTVGKRYDYDSSDNPFQVEVIILPMGEC